MPQQCSFRVNNNSTFIHSYMLFTLEGLHMNMSIGNPTHCAASVAMLSVKERDIHNRSV